MSPTHTKLFLPFHYWLKSLLLPDSTLVQYIGQFTQKVENMAATVKSSRLVFKDEQKVSTENLDNEYASRTGQSQRVQQYHSESSGVSAAVPRIIPEYILDAPVPGMREILGDVRRKGDCTRKAEAPPAGQPQTQRYLQRRQPRRRSNRPDHPGDEGDSDSDEGNNPKRKYGKDDEKPYDQNAYRAMNERAFTQNITQATQTQSLHNGQISR